MSDRCEVHSCVVSVPVTLLGLGPLARRNSDDSGPRSWLMIPIFRIATIIAATFLVPAVAHAAAGRVGDR